MAVADNLNTSVPFTQNSNLSLSQTIYVLPVPAEGEALTEALGLAEKDADTEAEGVLDGEALTEADGDDDIDALGEELIDAEGDADTLPAAVNVTFQ